MNWTDERVELLTKLWADGLSASQIAAELGGGVSRNAVIGKVHRLKLSSRGKTTPTSLRPKKAAEPMVASPMDTVVEPSLSRASRNSGASHSQPTMAAHVMANGLNATQANAVHNAAHATMSKNASLSTEASISSNSGSNFDMGNNAGRSVNRNMGAAALRMDYAVEDVVRVEKKSSADIVVPMSRRLSLLQLNEHTCKWPEGDPLSEDFYFCGADSGEDGPYCTFHAKLAFQPVSERRRIRV